MGLCITKYHRSGVLQRELFLTVPVARNLRSGCQRGQALVRAHFWVVDCQILVLTGRRTEKGSRLSHDSYEGPDVIDKGLALKNSSISYFSPKGPPLHIPSRDGFQHMNFRGTHTFGPWRNLWVSLMRILFFFVLPFCCVDNCCHLKKIALISTMAL